MRKRFFEAFVRARLTYACQTWSLTKAQMAKIESAHTSMLRSMVRNGHRRRNEVTLSSAQRKLPKATQARLKAELGYDPALKYNNDQIRAFCNSETIQSYIETQQRKFAAHIARMPNSRHVKQLAFNGDKFHKGGNNVVPLMDSAVKISGLPRDQFLRAARNREFQVDACL